MKKTLKAALSILLVLALLTALPLTAMAEGNLTQEGMPEGGYSENNEPSVTVESGVTVGNNYGRDVTNNGNIETNYGRDVTNNDTVVNNGPYYTHNPIIKENNGTVINNNGPDTAGNIYGGIVKKNNDGGEVLNNGGTVTDNFGYVGNKAGGTVTNNKDGGEVSNNGGTVGTNESGGVVNNESGTVTRNASAGNGEVTFGVINKGGTVGTNESGGVVYNDGGTVETNEVGGVVDNCKGTVNINKGTVVYNGIEGTVNNKENGTVENNLGTVVDTDGTTYYGLHGWYKDEDGYDTEHILGSYKAGAEINLDQKVAEITREGFKLTKYEIQVYEEAVARANVDAGDGDGGGEGEASKPLYCINAPTRLKLYWEKIVSLFKPAASSGGGAEAVPTSYNPKYIGLGSVVTINGSRYKVVEIKDDAYVVVSFDALSDEDVKDLNALYAKLFTPEQQKLIKNIGQLLDAEDVLTVFGKPGNHPVFEISKDLV